MTLPAPMAAALQQPAVMLPHCVQINLPSGDVNLSEAGFFSFDVDGVETTFHASDPVFGSLGSVGPIDDGVSMEAPTSVIEILPPSNAVLPIVSAANARNARVRVWAVTLDPVTNAVTGADLWLDGLLGMPTNTGDAKRRSISIAIKSRLARFLEPDEGIRLNQATLQRAYPGAKGLQYVSSVARNIPWGSDTPTGGLNAAQAAAISQIWGETYFGVKSI